MSVHVAVVVETKQISDQEIAVRLRCCGDATSDSWHTIKVLKDTASIDVVAWTNERIGHVQDGHAAVANAKTVFAGLAASAVPNINPGG